MPCSGSSAQDDPRCSFRTHIHNHPNAGLVNCFPFFLAAKKLGCFIITGTSLFYQLKAKEVTWQKGGFPEHPTLKETAIPFFSTFSPSSSQGVGSIVIVSDSRSNYAGLAGYSSLDNSLRHGASPKALEASGTSKNACKHLSCIAPMPAAADFLIVQTPTYMA